MVAPSFFETIAPYFDFLTRLFMMGTYEKVREKMLNEDTSSFRILDLCCGTGYITNTIRAKQIIGFDMSPRMLNLNAKVKRGNKVLIRGNAYHLPFNQDEFDRIYCSSATHEFKLFFRILNKSFEILKPGGKFICFDIFQPNNPLLSFVMNTFVRYVVEHGLMWIFTKEQWHKMLETVGFEVEEVDIIRGLYVFIRARKPLSTSI
jgi:demethylmenaquinone methyltransferase/2-methoxy-6-polyprenyl-1,4-benzoquinol methylase